MAGKHVEHLTKLLGHLRDERRNLAEKIITGRRMPKKFTGFVDRQQEFEAVERAMEDETREAAKEAKQAAAKKPKPESQHYVTNGETD
jgi:hypothetical protein